MGLTLGYRLWWTQSTTFTRVGNVFGVKQTTQTMSPVTFDMVQRSVHAEPEIITLNRVSPRVTVNSADALISFAICTRSGEPFMSAAGPALSSCETVSDVEGQKVSLTPDATTTITMPVTPQRQGRIVIKGMNVDYACGSGHLWQRGSQATGPVIGMHVSE